jgi:hypothetical protein
MELYHTPIGKMNTWNYHKRKFLRFLDNLDPEFTIFMKGNSKLPFYSFSTLPLFTCPGAMSCTKYCYSLKAWRYPAAFFRQFQNYILMRENRFSLAHSFSKLKEDSTIRLYVDGDFNDLSQLEFWFDLLKTRPDLNAYGYSKSWNVFLEYEKSEQEFPSNYTLNLSSGSRFFKDIDKLKELPVTRGEFIAVPVEVKQGSPEYVKQVREVAMKQGHDKVFVCPGKCGECTKKGHACGLESFENVTIAIGIH